MIKRWLAAPVVVALLMAGCGDRMPQSQEAKRLGDSPRQAVDKAARDTARAMQQGAEHVREAE